MIRYYLLSSVLALAACTSARPGAGAARPARVVRVATLDSATAAHL